MRRVDKTDNLVLTAMMLCLVCLATYALKVPNPFTQGYVHLGDTFIFISVLTLGTKNGAIAQGRDDTGVLKEGKKADLIVIDLSSPHMHPVHDMCANLVYSASPQDIVMTMVDGKVLYENGEFTTIDIEKAIAEADEATAQILEKLKND